MCEWGEARVARGVELQHGTVIAAHDVEERRQRVQQVAEHELDVRRVLEEL